MLAEVASCLIAFRCSTANVFWELSWLGRRDEPEWWEDLARRNMLVDCSWEQAASAYVDIYNQIAVT